MPLTGKVQLRLDGMGKRHALLREWKLEACDFWQQGGWPMVQGPGSRRDEQAPSEEESRLDTISESYQDKVISGSEWLVTLFGYASQIPRLGGFVACLEPQFVVLQKDYLG